MWIILAIITPVPLFHLWLHALLSFWKRWPLALYLWGAALWAGSFWLLGILGQREMLSYEVTPRIFFAVGLFALGIIGVIGSLATLGPKRFFVWAVLRPDSASKTKVGGIFSLIPHPAYLGYIVVALGLVLLTANYLTILVLIWLLALTPLAISLEEHEMRERLR